MSNRRFSSHIADCNEMKQFHSSPFILRNLFSSSSASCLDNVRPALASSECSLFTAVSAKWIVPCYGEMIRRGRDLSVVTKKRQTLCGESWNKRKII